MNDKGKKKYLFVNEFFTFVCMNTIMIICFFVFVLYFFQIIVFLVGFSKIKIYEPNSVLKDIENKKYLSVIIPFRNEENNLNQLLKSLSQQSLNSDFFEVIFVNDCSFDNSEDVLLASISKIKNYKYLKTNRLTSGKKNALKLGVRESETELIVTTDADCIHNKKWLETILSYYLENTPKMIIAPVLMKGKSFFENLQSAEFFSLIASTAGVAGIKRPIMCNGANLIYEKKVYNEFKNALKFEEVSGDDVFLMHNIKSKYPKDIHYLKSKNAITYTFAEKSLKSFFKQRFRWASKSKSYKDFDTIFVSLLVFITNFILGTLIISVFFNKDLFLIAGILFGTKFLVDFFFLLYVSNFFKQNKNLVFFPVLSLLYPFYIVFTVVGSLFYRIKI